MDLTLKVYERYTVQSAYMPILPRPAQGRYPPITKLPFICQ